MSEIWSINTSQIAHALFPALANDLLLAVIYLYHYKKKSEMKTLTTLFPYNVQGFIKNRIFTHSYLVNHELAAGPSLWFT